MPPVVDLLAEVETFPVFWGVSFLADWLLLGVYLITLSTLFLTSPPAAALAADFEAALPLPLAPPLTLGTAAGASALPPSLPFS